MMSGITGFDFQPRTRIVFGNESLDRLGRLARELGLARTLIVTDPGIVAAGHLTRARRSLEAANLTVFVYDRVRENPTTVDVDHCLAVARATTIDGFVGLGGGSSMDTAKGANFLLTNGGQMRDYWGTGKAKQPMLPLIAVPTTAGTGSECQSSALIADDLTHEKMACLDPKAAAKIALLDPTLTVSQPRQVTACTGIDAIAHAVETAVTRKRNELSWLYSREAFRLTVHHFERALDRPSDLEARAAMLLGAAFAGTAIELSMLGAAHSAANPLTSHFGTAHGAAVGMMLPHIVRFNAEDEWAREQYRQLAVFAGLADSAAPIHVAIDALSMKLLHLLNVTQLPQKFACDGVPIPQLAEEAAGQWTAQYNPRTIGAEHFELIYRSAREVDC